ncbi:MAG: glycosyltransferase family 4 protein [Candidatus Aminicenantes bacterium]|nr:glycosyltransferase family 4 protein [Candidatus Aminicenantes bacterium]
MDIKFRTRVLIIQGYNTPYRNELFNQIADYNDIDLTLLYISKRGSNKEWRDALPTRFKEVQVQCKIKQISYVDKESKLKYIDFLKKVVLLNPDVIISTLNKNTILINYIHFWKKLRLIHWSEANQVTERGINWFKKRYLKFHLNLPLAFLFPGRLAKEYHEHCGFDLKGNVFYAPNSVDEIYSITKKELENKFANITPLKILFVGSFVENKGFRILNSVFTRLLEAKYDIEFHVAGDGPLRPEEGIIDHGFLRKEEIAALNKKCHVFVMPSLADCNPLSLIEAAKAGNVLLASKGVGNHPELVNGNGYVFEIDNEDDLYAQCVKLLQANKDDLLTMGRRSVKLAAGITHENTARAFHDAIQYVAKK